jgi:hypothetical protein
MNEAISTSNRFYKQLGITEHITLKFKLANKILYVEWKEKWYRLSRKNPEYFYAKTTLKGKKKFGAELLHELHLGPPPKRKRKKEKPTPRSSETASIEILTENFKRFHNIVGDIPNLEVVNNRLTFLWNGKLIPLSYKKNINKYYTPLSLQKYGVGFNRTLKLPVKKRITKPKKTAPIQEIQNEIIAEAAAEIPQVFPANTFVLLPHAIRGFLKGYQMQIEDSDDPIRSLEEATPKIIEIINRELQELGSVKFSLALRIKMSKDSDTYATPTFFSKKVIVLNDNDEIILDDIFAAMIESIETFTNEGSGWEVETVETLWLNIAKYQPLRGGSYIDLPKVLKNKKVIINVKNKDDNCLRWALRSALFPASDHSDRPSKYPTNDGLNFNGIEAPTPSNQIKKVEKMNNLAINLFGWEKGAVIPIETSKQPYNMQRINLMLISKTEEDEIKTHYTWIKNFNGLLYNQTKHKEKKHFCDRCMTGYSRHDLLEDHKIECRGNGERPIHIVMPTKDKSTLKFEKYQNQMKVPYVIYADFEALTTKIDEHAGLHTKRTQVHEACGFSYVVVRSDGESYGPGFYRGPDAVDVFLDNLGKCETKILEILSNPIPMEITNEEQKEYDKATTCWICNNEIIYTNKKVCMNQQAVHKRCKNTKEFEWIKLENEEKYYKATKCAICKGAFSSYKVRDHDHLTGKYRGAAHNDCNLKLRIKPKEINIPVVFHNLKGYDAHLIMQGISNTEGAIKCIPNNMEKYISFSLRQLRFIDSAQFMATSLDKLVKANKPEAFNITRGLGPHPELLLRKGVYPYEFMDSWERFNDEELPPIEEFFSKLSDEGITNQDYNHAKKVWETFNCKNMGDYHDLYLKTDTCLLADVFEEFRKKCLLVYKLDPAHYYTSPGLAFDALLKKSEVNLELLTNYDMFLMIEKGMRGGTSMVSKRFSKANNPNVPDFDETKEKSHIIYLDANNLYGWAMAQYLPTGKFQWVDVPLTEIINTPKDSDKGYILEVDLEYPAKLHNSHNDYPLAPERMKIKKEWLSPYQKNLNMKCGNVEKLVPNLQNKTKYVLHYRNLQFYLSLGMRVTKVHRVLQFAQSAWMESYIQMNTELRKQATSDFEKDLYKLMNNSVFGKTMENMRKRVDVHLVRADEKNKIRKLIAKPTFSREKIFNNDLAAIHMYKSKLKLNRPSYVGMCILDLSKILMYDFYYNQLKTQYGNKCELLYTDTDSLLLQIKTEDIYKDIAQNIEMYDTSNFPKNHSLFNEKNKKVIGKMKDECGGTPISEYVGLRPKMYSIMKTDGDNIKKAKGIKQYVVKKQMRHENYKESLFNNKIFRHNMNMLRSDHHQIYGVQLNKISLSPLDTKRWIADDGISTLAYGHYKIPSGGN